jgi:hypothetical protein
VDGAGLSLSFLGSVGGLIGRIGSMMAVLG